MIAKIRSSGARPAISVLALAAFVALPGPGLGTVTLAFAQTTDDLQRAQDHYDFAEFAQALAIVATVLASPDQPLERQRDAYILQARCQVGLDQRAQAENSFCAALALDPNWRPDPIFFPRAEILAFDAALAACPPPPPDVPLAPAPGKPWYKKPIVWAGAAAAVVLVLLLSGDDDEEPLPDPPAPPERP